MKRVGIAMMGLGVVLLGTIVRPPGQALAAPLPPPSGRLDQLAIDFAGKLGPALEGRRVPTLTLNVQLRQPPGAFSTGHQQLSRVLAQLVATRLRGLRFRALRLAQPHLAAEAVLKQAIVGGFDLTLLVTLVERGGRLHLRGRLYDTNVTLWGKLAGRRATLLTHLAVSTRVGPTIRSYLSQPPKSAVTCSGGWTPLGRRAYWGVALGDVDGDGRQELVLLRRDALEIRRWSVVYHRFDEVATVAFSGPPAKVTPRFVLASLAVGDLDGDRREDIVVRVSERATAAQISYQKGAFTVKRRLAGYPFGMAFVGGQKRIAMGYPLDGRAEFNGRGVSWKPTLSGQLLLPGVFHNLRFADARSVKGRREQIYAFVDRQSRLTVRRLTNNRMVQRLSRVGRAFALGDLTGDGHPEVITTTTQSFGSSDALVVRQLGRAGPLCRVAGFEGSVTAVTVGDVHLMGRTKVVAVVWNAVKRQSYLLIVR